jgi:PPK2 family polyphosphate:nucleotide phosphotransferase
MKKRARSRRRAKPNWKASDKLNGDKFHPKPGSKLRLKQIDPDEHGDYDKQQAVEETAANQKRIEEFQQKLYAQGAQALLIVLQAMDTGGKDGTIRKVFEGVNPQGVQVTSFKAPTADELAHDFLWRVHRYTPPKGYIGIFNRSHYEDVLIVRVNKLVPDNVWEARYDHINNFERLLAESGTRILKFYLHISKDEQKERLQSRLDNPDKNWKFERGDLAVRERWDDYMDAYQDAITRCNTDYAPWYVIPANHKWFRDLVVSRIIADTLQDMKPVFPKPEAGLDQVVIPD